MWKNKVEPGRPQITNNMAHAHCMLVTQTYKTYSLYAICIHFSLQQRLHYRASNIILHVHCLVLCVKMKTVNTFNCTDVKEPFFLKKNSLRLRGDDTFGRKTVQ
jgi:hypothetical protein